MELTASKLETFCSTIYSVLPYIKGHETSQKEKGPSDLSLPVITWQWPQMQTYDYARSALWDTAIKFSLQSRALTSPDGSAY